MKKTYRHPKVHVIVADINVLAAGSPITEKPTEEAPSAGDEIIPGGEGIEIL